MTEYALQLLLLAVLFYSFSILFTMLEVEQFLPIQRLLFTKTVKRRNILLRNLRDLLNGFNKIEQLSRNEIFKKDLEKINKQIIRINNSLEETLLRNKILYEINYSVYRSNFLKSLKEINLATFCYLKSAPILILSSLSLLINVEVPLFRARSELRNIRNNAKQVYKDSFILLNNFEKLLDSVTMESKSGIETVKWEKSIDASRKELSNLSKSLEFDDTQIEKWLISVSRYEEILKEYEDLKLAVEVLINQRKKLDREVELAEYNLSRYKTKFNTEYNFSKFNSYFEQAERMLDNVRSFRKNKRFNDATSILSRLNQMLSFLDKTVDYDRVFQSLAEIKDNSQENKTIKELLQTYQTLLSKSRESNFDQYLKLELELKKIADLSKNYLEKHNNSLKEHIKVSDIVFYRLRETKWKLIEIASFDQEPTLRDLQKLLDTYDKISNNITKLEEWIRTGEYLVNSIEKFIERITIEIRETEHLLITEKSLFDDINAQTIGWTFAKQKLDEVSKYFAQARQNLSDTKKSSSIEELNKSLAAVNGLISASKNLRETILNRFMSISKARLEIERDLAKLKEGNWSHLSVIKNIVREYPKVLEELRQIEDYDLLMKKIKDIQNRVDNLNIRIQVKETELEMEEKMNKNEKVSVSNIHLVNSQLFINNQDLVATLKNLGKEDIAEAVNDISKAIIDSKNLTEETKKESIDTINKFAEEANKEKPNKTFLKSLFNGLKSTLSLAPDVIKVILAAQSIIDKYIS